MEKPRYDIFYSIPPEYNPPADSDLSTDTQYPNLNSEDYRKRLVKNRGEKIQQFYEAFTFTEDNEVILASNDIRSRIWDGSIWGFSKIDDFGDEKKSCFKTNCDSPVTNLLTISKTTFILSTANGTVQLWSPKSPIQNVDGYCLFMVGDCQEHTGIILSMDVFSNEGTKTVTGSNDCCLKIWDVGADLYSIHTMRYAHSDSITGISSLPDSESIFVSCSRDKSALIWDYREPRPALGLYEDNEYGFTAVYSTKSQERNNQIILGDETGKIYFVDQKMPNKILSSHQIYQRPIRKIKCHGKQMVILGNTDLVKVFKLEDNGDENLEMSYKDHRSTNLVRDIQWDKLSENEFYTIGWDSKLLKHVIP